MGKIEKGESGKVIDMDEVIQNREGGASEKAAKEVAEFSKEIADASFDGYPQVKGGVCPCGYDGTFKVDEVGAICPKCERRTIGGDRKE